MSNKQDEINFARVADAIEYITRNYQEQPSLFDIAEEANVSIYHFQQLFTEWAGVSPKKFLQYISVNRAKRILKEGQGSLFDAAFETGLSGTGRLHELFIHIEGMTPGEYKVGGKGLTINYRFAKTLFGEILVASTSKGVCYMTFCDNREQALAELGHHFPFATFEKHPDEFQERALAVFSMDWTNLNEVKLHLRGTEFQLKVWETLLKIPMGTLTTYGDIANYLDSPSSSRAVGTAVGDKPGSILNSLSSCHSFYRCFRRLPLGIDPQNCYNRMGSC